MVDPRHEFRYSDFKCDLSGICVKFPGIGETIKIGEKLGCGAYGDVFGGYRMRVANEAGCVNCDDDTECKRRNVDLDRSGMAPMTDATRRNNSPTPRGSVADACLHPVDWKRSIDTTYAESSPGEGHSVEYPDYAIKYFKDDTAQFTEEGFCSGTLRELSIMKTCNDHPNIVKLLDIYVGAHADIAAKLNAQLGEILKNNNGKMVCRKDLNFFPIKNTQVFVLALYEYCKGGDLGRAICRMYSKGNSGYTLPEVKWYAYQLLNGLAYQHMSKIEHRDLKPNNIMLADNKRLTVLKIGDWGMGREFRAMDGSVTPTACTLFYRPIEVILGALPLLDNANRENNFSSSQSKPRKHNYGINVDNWSAGCIIAELATGQPLFHGNSDFQVLTRIVTTLGRPTEEEWRNCSKSEYYPFTGSLYKISIPDKKERLRAVLKGRMDSLGLDLLLSLLQYNPHKRISAIEALSHPWFHDLDFRQLDSLGVRNCLGNALMGMLGTNAVKAMENHSPGITSTTLLPHLLFNESTAKEQVIDALDRDHLMLEPSSRQPQLPIVVQYNNTPTPQECTGQHVH